MDLNFVHTPPDDLICSICLLVHRDPVLTSCCGNHFCKSCVEQVRSEQRPCPLCGVQPFTTMLDKYFVRKVNELEVVCHHKERGCSWTGSVSALNRHLDPKKGDCQYLKMECPYFCGAIINCSELKSHQNVCGRRPYACKFCGYEGVYEDMSSKHWKMCEKYPLPCPNDCGTVDIPREDLQKHLKENCSLERNECEFSYAGCTACLSKSELSKHLSNNLQYHLSLVSKYCLKVAQSFPEELHGQMKQQLTAKDSEIKTLQSKLKENDDTINLLQGKLMSLELEVGDLRMDCLNLKSVVMVPPFDFIMTEFRKHKLHERQWLSPAFYSHFGGYRMCISVDAGGSEEGRGTHVSVYVNLMKGEYDDHLKWPFKGSIVLELCNQRSYSGNLQENIMFTYDASEIAQRVTAGEVAEQGLGIPTFIEHNQLGYNLKKNVEFLKHDCLRFRVVRVDFMNRRNTSVS